VLAVGLVFGQVIRHEFVNYDDFDFVCCNSHLSQGVTAEGIGWALTYFHGHYWVPLTWLSLMLDFQLYGFNAGGHHLTNVLLHAATTVLLFLVLRRLTGGFWRSALVAALFAVHPLHVESVAWVMERKDVLSGLFFVLTLGTYASYVRKPFSLSHYLLLVAFFVMGVMAKPILVTLPLVLLLLDYWPLGRLTFAATADISPDRDERQGRFTLPMRCFLEKIPLLLLVLVFCVATYWAMKDVVVSKEQISFSSRIANALVSYVAYLTQLFCPVGLAVFYPHQGVALPVWKVTGALVIFGCISMGVLAYARRYPYLLVGWLWYVVTLVPVIGLVQVGDTAMADRFTYLTQIGLYMALAWGVADLCRSWPYRRWICGVTAALVLVVLMGCAWRQTSFWRNSETLWTHTLACTSRNGSAHNNLAFALAEQGRLGEAIEHYREAINIKPDDAVVHFNLAVALGRQGRLDEAIVHYRKGMETKSDDADAHYLLGTALQSQGKIDEAIAEYQKAVEIKPDRADAHYRLGTALVGRGRFDEAIGQFGQAVQINPGYTEAHNNLGSALFARGKFDEAITHYRQAVTLKSDYAMARNNLGMALARRGRFDEAISQFGRVLQFKPDDVAAHNSLAWLRATCPQALRRNGNEAVEHAQRANQLCGGARPEVLDTLAAAYAEAGRFPEALATARQALEWATRRNNPALAETFRGRIALYEAKKPYHQTLPAPAPPLKP
jgi:tetratricopeptide (TPR) repeat protein